MLAPGHRALLLESLRPPEGYRLDRAVGTSYSLDLLALLTAPLAFTFFDWEDQEGKPVADPISLLESLRRHADRIHLFCQAGEIKLPPPSQRLVAYLERCVIPVQAPADRRGHRGIFHPKAWLLRYVSDGAPARYRFTCASRNLTFDRSWDTILCVEGELVERSRAISVSRPIGDFVAALPGLAVRPLDPDVRLQIERMASEVQRVRFELPEELEEIAFWPLGIDGYKRPPFDADRRKRPFLIMSPFLSGPMLGRLGKDRDSCILISRAEELADQSATTLGEFNKVYALSNSAEDAEEDREGAERSVLAGLHAKVFIEDDGWNARVYVGSANATSAAFESNVEFMVELKGKRKDFGIDTFLGEEGAKDGVRALLEPWQAGQHNLSEEAAIENALDLELAKRRRAIAAHGLTLHCLAEGGDADRYYVELRAEATIPAGMRQGWSCWLGSQHDEDAIEIACDAGVLGRFGPIGMSSLTAFLACRISASQKGVTRESRFLLNLPIEGLPKDRLGRLLASQIQDRDRLIRLLLLLLQADGEADAFAEAMLGNESDGKEQRRAANVAPLFEVLVRATVDGKERLTEMGRLLEDLMRTDEGRALVPSELIGLWQEITKLIQGADEHARRA